MEAITYDESVRNLVAEMQGAREGFEGDMADVQMHRFPTGLLGLGDRYIAPVLVAIGPYHHGSEHLHKMEQVKRAAALHLLEGTGCSPQQVYEDVRGVADNASKLYADLNKNLLPDFAKLMFYDACFLLYYMEVRDFDGGNSADALSKLFFSNRACIDNDVMLLENQLPLRIIRAIIKSLPQPQLYKRFVGKFIERMGTEFNITEKKHPDRFDWNLDDQDEDQSLLGLLRRYKTAGKQEPESWLQLQGQEEEIQAVSTTSAIELAEIGIKLTASKTPVLADMGLSDLGPLFGKLSLAPLSLNKKTECLLVNMAALEVATGVSFGQLPEHSAVCSYLSLLSMLMLRDEDVHELRAKQILRGDASNPEMQDFFKRVFKHLPDPGSRFTDLMFNRKLVRGGVRRLPSPLVSLSSMPTRAPPPLHPSAPDKDLEVEEDDGSLNVKL
ncbi:hypothetical protein QOZ80_8AG0621680 [Eleusine coracana subsp. coracana]|nr:hypothetical protein QOZ80_8AG0621680 [Eleusine coracana subsp. coracana]